MGAERLGASRRSPRPAGGTARARPRRWARASCRRCGRGLGDRRRGRRGALVAAAAPRGGGDGRFARDPAALDDGVGDHPAQERARADRVVVARDHVVDDVGVAVRVDDGDDRQAELARLGDRDVLLLRVDHEDRVREPLEVARCRPRLRSSFSSSRRVAERLALRHALEVAGAICIVRSSVMRFDAARDGLEVGEHAARASAGSRRAYCRPRRSRRRGPGSASSCPTNRMIPPLATRSRT